MMDKDSMDNFIIIPTEEEDPKDIIEDYANVATTCESVEEFEELLSGFFQEISSYIDKHYNIMLGLLAVDRLKEIQQNIYDMRGFTEDE